MVVRAQRGTPKPTWKCGVRGFLREWSQFQSSVQAPGLLALRGQKKKLGKLGAVYRSA